MAARLRRRKLLALLLASGAVFVSCSTGIPEGAAPFTNEPYYLTRGGITNKYYIRYDRGSNYEVAGQIEYRTDRLRGDGLLETSVYSPAFAVERKRAFAVDEHGLSLVSTIDMSRRDTIAYDVYADRFLAFANDTATASWGNEVVRYERRQQAVVDTAWEGREAHLVRGTIVARDSAGTTVYTADYDELYAAGAGLVYGTSRDGSTEYTLTLDRQLSPKQVDSLRATVPKRVAYIDPERTLIPEPEGWSTCGTIDRIADYYNATPDVGYRGGLYGLHQDLVPHLDLSGLTGESGYLTFRFVINCRGEVGRFTTDEATLNYQPKHFPRAPVVAIAEQIQALTDWDRGQLNDEPRDFYAYLTLKLDDGQFVDVLP